LATLWRAQRTAVERLDGFQHRTIVLRKHADSDDAAMSFRDHAAIYSGLIPPPCVGLFDGLVLG
jgi:hypothetical protein